MYWSASRPAEDPETCGGSRNLRYQVTSFSIPVQERPYRNRLQRDDWLGAIAPLIGAVREELLLPNRKLGLNFVDELG